MKTRPTITVFGSARCRPGSAEYIEAEVLGSLLAENGFSVCNGAYGGTMEASARGAKNQPQGRTMGIACKEFAGRNPNSWLDEVIWCQTHLERMQELIARGDGYAVLRGGTGTLLELAAVWEYVAKGVIPRKPIVTVGGVWLPVVATVAGELHREGVHEAADLVHCVTSPQEAMEILRSSIQEGTGGDNGNRV